MTTQETQLNSAMTIRRLDLTDRDLEALEKLAELDSGEALEGAVLGIEVEGRLLAAIEIETGKVIADPFSRTSELRALLKLRASQLDNRPGRLPKRELRLFGRRTRPAVGGSPAGQIISLPRP
ncbi:MAG TPA: hypothetical protein VD765_05980 [Solirubrobacterales bacterium]|nr:hypothetical protein [Solirubrobacterales bacterium]